MTMSISSIIALSMTISQKIEGKYSPIGDVTYYCPTLAAFGIDAPVVMDKEGKPTFEDGLPVYTTDEQNWLQKAILQQVKAQARNKLQPASIDLKDGQAIATTLAELCAESEGSTAALEAVRQIKALWAKWVAGSGKSAATQSLLVTLFGNKAALGTQTSATKEKFAGYLGDFCASLTDEQLASGTRYLDSLLAVAKAEVTAEDF